MHPEDVRHVELLALLVGERHSSRCHLLRPSEIAQLEIGPGEGSQGWNEVWPRLGHERSRSCAAFALPSITSSSPSCRFAICSA